MSLGVIWYHSGSLGDARGYSMNARGHLVSLGVIRWRSGSFNERSGSFGVPRSRFGSTGGHLVSLGSLWANRVIVGHFGSA